MPHEVKGAGAGANTRKRAFNEGKRHFKKNKKQKADLSWPDGSNEEVLQKDVSELLRRLEAVKVSSDGNEESLPEPFTTVDIDIEEISSTGDGLGLIPGTRRVAIVPFVSAGDRVTAKLIRHDRDHPYTVADFIKVVRPGPQREDSLIRCQYFAKCSGCQFQMISETDQLKHKMSIIKKAYKNFSQLPEESYDHFLDVTPSPRAYGYRTKLTPHFDGPTNGRKDRRHGNKVTWQEVPPIGFMLKGTRKTMDIEDCPIGTDAVRRGMKRERARVANEIDTYQRGATLLLREHTEAAVNKEGMEADEPTSRTSDGMTEGAVESPYPADAVIEDGGFAKLVKTCITDPRATSTEYIGRARFDNPASSFFQNNNSILSPFIDTIARHIFSLPSDSTAAGNDAPESSNPHNITHLVDAYSGSGLFTITLAHLFTKSIGIDISAQSIESATRNAQLNNLSQERASFLAGDAANIFAHVSSFPADQTAVIIDPSRKGCDMAFLSQLLSFAPRRVCYVSCNVHTQARDVGVLCHPETGRYDVEAIMGFDFFPQTAHVEGLAVLARRDALEAGIEKPVVADQIGEIQVPAAQDHNGDGPGGVHISATGSP